jgi:hypothetical protein
MKYMLLIYSDESSFSSLSAQEQADTMAAFRRFTDALGKSGVVLSANRLASISAATTLRADGNDIQVVDGPFSETKEQLGGYYLIEAPDLDAALKWARDCPGVQRGCVEVGPIMETPASK